MNIKEVLSQVDSIGPITTAQPNQLSFCVFTGKKAVEMIKKSKARVIVCHEDLELTLKKYSKRGKLLLFSPTPRLTFTKIARVFFLPKVTERTIHPSVVIGENVTIGERTIIGPNVTIYDNVQIGEDCLIKAGAVIGGAGFGFEKDTDGKWIQFPQIGKVIIGNNVFIGSCTCVDRGALGDTIIEDGVKIDNLCHIAHNIHFERNVMVIALSEISGGVRIGTNTYIAPSCSVLDNLTIGANCLIGIGSLVLKDIPEHSVAYGRPATVKNNQKEVKK